MNQDQEQSYYDPKTDDVLSTPMKIIIAVVAIAGIVLILTHI